MRRAFVLVHNIPAGLFEELAKNHYRFTYLKEYDGSPVSLILPIKNESYEFDQFPSFFDGLLPEGLMLEALLRQYKLDKQDYFGQLVQVGHDLIGAVTVESIE